MADTHWWRLYLVLCWITVIPKTEIYRYADMQCSIKKSSRYSHADPDNEKSGTMFSIIGWTCDIRGISLLLGKIQYASDNMWYHQTQLKILREKIHKSSLLDFLLKLNIIHIHKHSDSDGTFDKVIINWQSI